MTANIEPHIISKCGWRPSNEDVERYKLNLSTDGGPIDIKFAPADFFVLCDGHGGSEVANFVAPSLEKYLMANQLTYPLSKAYILKVYNFLQKKLQGHPQQIASSCGSTALVVVLYVDQRKNRCVQVINIGDCRVLLSRNGLPMALSVDHKPSWPDEKRRIDEVNKKHGSNQQVKFLDGDFRIGDLSVSRAFGDLDNTPHVTHIPDVFNYKLHSTDEFIVMACDGVWDVLRNEEVVNFIRDHLTNNHIDLYNIPHVYPFSQKQTKNIASKLADYAIARGSTDNVSIIIIIFRH